MKKVKTFFGIVKTFKNWPTYFADRYGLIKKKNIIYLLRNGIKCKARARTNDKKIINEIWERKIYNPKNFEIRESDVILDIGAHIGCFSVFASKLAEKGRIFSFEPFPENFALLKDNILLNKINNITSINKALGNKNGKTDIFLSMHNTGGHSFYSSHKNSEKKIKVDVTSLPSFMKENKISKINFLKMDCEGAEFEILFNCPKDTLEKIEKISMEYHNKSGVNNVNVLKQYLENNGFKVIIKNNNIHTSYGMLYAHR
ncbi:MAG: FkbM family methyltransferase [Nanoarchaeota archaeon]